MVLLEHLLDTLRSMFVFDLGLTELGPKLFHVELSDLPSFLYQGNLEAENLRLFCDDGAIIIDGCVCLILRS